MIPSPEVAGLRAPLVALSNLSLSLGGVRVLRDVQLSLRADRVNLLVGANGSGKTSLIKVLAGLLTSATGTMTWGGPWGPDGAPSRDAFGIVLENEGLYERLRVAEHVDLFGRLQGLFGNRLREARDRVLTEVGLTKEAQRTVSQLSLGYRRRVGLAKALVHSPSIILLDEPTNGLDPVAIRQISALLRRLADGSRTVVIASHELSEILVPDTHLIVMKAGRAVFSGDASQLEGTGPLRERAIELLGSP